MAEERWRGVWQVAEPGNYALQVKSLAGNVTLSVDGETVLSEATNPQEQAAAATVITLAAGPHEMELVQVLESGIVWSGVQLSVQREVLPPVAGEMAQYNDIPVYVDIPLQVRPP